jgi:hypothetical protein
LPSRCGSTVQSERWLLSADDARRIPCSAVVALEFVFASKR